MTREIRLTLNLFFIFVLAWQFCYCQLIDDEDLINNFFSSGTPILNTTITTEKELIDSIFNNQTLNNDNVIVTCSNGEHGPGECTHYYLCDNKTIITDGSGTNNKTLINFRIDTGDYRECPILKPCCSLKSKLTKPNMPNITIPRECGIRNPSGLGFKTINRPGLQAQEAEFPWTIAILERTDTNPSGTFICGGSLIHPSVVMTAAHTIDGKKPENLIIRAGEWDSLSTDEYYKHQEREISEFIVHEQFDGRNGYNDIALIILRSPVKITENVNTVCLPNAINATSFDGIKCTASGWGTTTWEGRNFESIMKKIDLPIVAHDECQMKLRTTRLGHHFELHEKFLCAGGEPGVDTCQGDGGSPLFCPSSNLKFPNKYYQVGIVSWGIACGDPIPGVYANVAKLRPWIDSQMARKEFHTSSYIDDPTTAIDFRGKE